MPFLIPSLVGLGVWAATQADDALEGWGVTTNPHTGQANQGSINQTAQLALLAFLAYVAYKAFVVKGK